MTASDIRLREVGSQVTVGAMHPLLAEAMVEARWRELNARAPRWVPPAPRPRRPPRRPARVALGMRLIGLGLRLVDIPANLPLGHDPA